MARPRLLDDVMKREICALTTAGMVLEKVADYIGCDVKTIRRERQRDEEFDARMRRSDMAANLNPLEAMRKASSTHWRAAAWMLEREDRRTDRRRDRQQRDFFSRNDLEALAAEVKRLVMPAVFHPFGKSELEAKLDLLFTLARPGRCTPQIEAEPTTVSRLEESQEFLENRIEDRQQAGSPTRSALQKLLAMVRK